MRVPRRTDGISSPAMTNTTYKEHCKFLHKMCSNKYFEVMVFFEKILFFVPGPSAIMSTPPTPPPTIMYCSTHSQVLEKAVPQPRPRRA